MHTVKITGWRDGFDKIKCTKYLQEFCGLTLTQAKKITDFVLDGITQETYLPSLAQAEALSRSLNEIGAYAIVVRPKSTPCLKVVLYCPEGHKPGLYPLLQELRDNGVTFIAVAGKDCEFIEDRIDEFFIENKRFVITSSHANEELNDAIFFAQSLTQPVAGEPQLEIL